MRVVNAKSLICSNDHCFDISKYGYVNLLSRSVNNKYDKKMFKSRRTLSKSGFFEPLYERITKSVMNRAAFKNEVTKVLDAGCGEGSNLSSILQKINQSIPYEFLGVGVDISKEAIIAASRHYKSCIWCVADLAKCPFYDKQFDLILNILSPANYSEFQRILEDEGLVIKVVPDKDYLQEIREILYEKTNKQHYSNDKTLELFRDNLDILDILNVRYTRILDNALIRDLIQMTPLSWSATEVSLQKILKMNSLEITIDLTILLGRKKL